MPDNLPASETDPRIDQIVAAILRIADMDFELLLRPSPQRDQIDAIIVGINTMAGELESVYQELDERVAERTGQLERARQQMETLAYSDPLTGLSNRFALIRAIDESI